MLADDLKSTLERQFPIERLPDSKSEEAMQDLLKHPGIPLLYSLLLGSKQAYLVALSHAQLTNMETVAQAAVIQGVIRGIDLFGSTLLEQAVPSPNDQQEQV